MTLITIVGPLLSESEAKETARALGAENHSVYSRAIVDADGFDTGGRTWFVERDDSIAPRLIFGMTWQEIQAKQAKR